MLLLNIIFAAIIGCLFGNYASTVLYRLPRSIPISGYNQNIGRAPHCSVCNHPLKFYEYFPILSWISTLGTCNYCGCRINKDYILLEVLSGILAVTLLLLEGSFSEHYLLLLLFGVLLLLAWMMDKYSSLHAIYILAAAGALGTVFRTLQDSSILPMIFSSVTAYFLYISITRKSENKLMDNFSLVVLLVAGIWLPVITLLIYCFILWVISLNNINTKGLKVALLYLLTTL